MMRREFLEWKNKVECQRNVTREAIHSDARSGNFIRAKYTENVLTRNTAIIIIMEKNLK